MKKRLLSAIVSLCLLLTMAPTVAFAAEESADAPVLVEQGDAPKVEEAAEEPAEEPVEEPAVENPAAAPAAEAPAEEPAERKQKLLHRSRFLPKSLCAPTKVRMVRKELVVYL